MSNLTKQQKAEASIAFQNLFARNGLIINVSFTRKGYCRLIVPKDTMKNFTCIADVRQRASEILQCNANSFYIDME